MKKLSIAIALSLLALTWWALPGYTASLTMTGREDGISGNMRVIYGVLTANSGDTFATGMDRVRMVNMTRDDNNTNNQYGASISGGTITFYTNTNGVTFRVMIVGK